jgi:hypothetical protein
LKNFFSKIDLVLEKTPSETIKKSTSSFEPSVKLIFIFSLFFSTLLTCLRNIIEFDNNFSFKNFIKVDLF